MGSGVSAAVKDASQEDIQAALQEVSPAAQARVAVAVAWVALEAKVKADPFLVSEASEMKTPPPSVAKIEELLCKLCDIAKTNLYSPDGGPAGRSAQLSGELAEAETMAAKVRSKAFVQALATVKANEESKSQLAEFLKDEDLSPDKIVEHGSSWLWMVSVWLHALSGNVDFAGKHELPTAEDELFGSLQEKIVGSCGDIASYYESEKEPHPSVVKLEKVLCKLCGVEIMTYESLDADEKEITVQDVHLTARLRLYSPTSEDLGEELEQASRKIAEVQSKYFLANLATVKAGEDTKTKLAEFAQNEDLSADNMAKRSSLMASISAWLLALSR
eukprot:TRINITY_DN4482_c0_g1_i2.p1 TRINITY_DN4482_c0_g1~~TRINITY_DN4482_c0_g1_i2.p1  ORF type:complete len:332 (-),score=83.20 TRINITY_DN4482_c0_g1_i2:350-1345(-)